MGAVHDLIQAEGRQAALKDPELNRREIDAAAAYLADEDNAIGFIYSGFCQAALPHRRLPDTESWQIENDRLALIVSAGAKRGPAGKPIPVGVPYGSRARLILIFLQSEAIRSQSREIELGGSLRAWLVRLGIPQGGSSIASVRDQAERIGYCRMTFSMHEGRHIGFLHQSIVDSGFAEDESPKGDKPHFMERVKLSEAFYTALHKHPVPLEDAAVRQISNNSMALDVYVWLAYRLHSLPAPRAIRWVAVRDQFGAGFSRMDNFRPTFLDNLRLALAVYPKARVEIEDKGLVMHPSPPPVEKRVLSR